MTEVLTGETRDHDVPAASGFLKRLLHRWLVEYNPAYLLSATLVLVGVTLISSDLPSGGDVLGELGVTAIAELYATALIAGAAFLTRVGLRRPAVMLALVTSLYQCDPTLHTERSVYLDHVGALGELAWVVLFVIKLYALAWALEVRPSRSAIAIPTAAAVGLAVIPRYFQSLDARALALLIALWTFGLFAAGAWSERALTSRVPLDAWGQTVLRRSRRAIWTLWAAAWIGHVAFWSAQLGITLVALVPVAVLVGTRWMRRESSVWCVAIATLGVAAIAMPPFFSACALMVAITLIVRALRLPSYSERKRDVAAEPYRASATERTDGRSVAETEFRRAPLAATQRLFGGALFAFYLSIWTIGWSGGAFPEHVLALDVGLSAVVFAIAWKRRARSILIPLAGSYLHAVVQSRIIPAPESTFQWGAASVGVGFALLVASLMTSYVYRKPPA